ncbi:MAG: hypothetical protein ACR2OZ_05785 [Verrucomicrobiales bacterium]
MPSSNRMLVPLLSAVCVAALAPLAESATIYHGSFATSPPSALVLPIAYFRLDGVTFDYPPFGSRLSQRDILLFVGLSPESPSFSLRSVEVR